MPYGRLGNDLSQMYKVSMPDIHDRDEFDDVDHMTRFWNIQYWCKINSNDRYDYDGEGNWYFYDKELVSLFVLTWN